LSTHSASAIIRAQFATGAENQMVIPRLNQWESSCVPSSAHPACAVWTQGPVWGNRNHFIEKWNWCYWRMGVCVCHLL